MRLYSLKSPVPVAVLLLLATTFYCTTLSARSRHGSSVPGRQGLSLQNRQDVSGQNQDTSGQDKEIVINGKVIAGESSSPLEGAGILVKGTKNVTGTQVDGTFTLLVRPGDKVLVITAEGYKAQEVPITKATEYYVTLQPL
jgi:hypothetical protein